MSRDYTLLICPKCGSKNVQRTPKIDTSTANGTVPLWKFWIEYHCFHCNHDWEKE